MSESTSQAGAISPRSRVLTALNHQQPDRQPVDFLATPEIWRQLQEHLAIPGRPLTETDYFDPVWEAILRHFRSIAA